MNPINILRFCAIVALNLITINNAQAEPITAEKLFNENVPVSILRADNALADMLFDRQDNVTNKPLQILLMQDSGALEEEKLYLGARYMLNHMRERSNTAGKFPIISRFPNQHASDKTGSETLVGDLSFNGVMNFDSWLTLFAQREYTEIFYPGQEPWQWRKFFVMVGDLDSFPVYATFGRDTIPFGKMDTYAPFTHNYNTHYFWAQAEKPFLSLGYYKDGLHAQASLIPSGRGLRTTNTEDKSGYDNFALNASYTGKLDNGVKYEFGGGFLRSTIYDSTLAHHPPGTGIDNETNSAWDVNLTLNWRNFDLMGEFTQTTDKWPASLHKVRALTVQGRYNDSILSKPTTYSLSVSRGEQGEDGVEWERMIQTVAGIETQLHPNISLGLEYVNNVGFAPLIRIQNTSDRSVVSHTLVSGIKITF